MRSEDEHIERDLTLHACRQVIDIMMRTAELMDNLNARARMQETVTRTMFVASCGATLGTSGLPLDRHHLRSVAVIQCRRMVEQVMKDEYTEEIFTAIKKGLSHG